MVFDSHRLAVMDSYVERNVERFMAALARLVAVPSVAAQNRGIREGAELAATLLREHGYPAEILPADGGSPVVLGEGRAEAAGAASARCSSTTTTTCSRPSRSSCGRARRSSRRARDGRLFGRGVSDDKGHLTSRLLAIDALLADGGELPCRVKFVIEGEEEIGSVHLPAFLHAHRERLAGDACLWEFGGVDHREVPMQYAGLRGICYVELSVRDRRRRTCTRASAARSCRTPRGG